MAIQKKVASQGYADNAAKIAIYDTPLFLTPEMFGAKGDGETDDSTAIQETIDAAGKTQMSRVYLSAQTYKISTGLKFKDSHTQFYCDGKLVYDGTGDAITVLCPYLNIYVNKISAPNGTGVALRTTSENTKSVLANNIQVNSIEESVYGLQIISENDSYCISYNTIRIGAIKSSNTCIFVNCAATNSWITENWYYCGKLSHATVGIKISNPDSNTYESGSNKFMSGIIENLASDACALWLENTSHNEFKSFRCAENYGSTQIKFVGDCSSNNIGMTRVLLDEVDISEMTEGNKNYLRYHTKTGKTTGYDCGEVASVSYSSGITYDPRYADIGLTVQDGYFADNIIKQDKARIFTHIKFNRDVANKQTFKLGKVYCDSTSMAKGFPLTITFTSNSEHGKIRLADYDDNTIVDNTNGEYIGRTLSVRWLGYDKVNLKNVWEVNVLNDQAVLSSQLPAAINTALAQAKESGEFNGKNGTNGTNGTNGISATHSWNGTTLTITSASGTSSADLKGAKGDKGDAYTLTDSDKNTIAAATKASMPTVTITGVDANGVSHSWTMYGVIQ